MKPLFISIEKTSTFAKAKLSRCCTGQIHSVYRKTINILTDQGLLALQAAGSPLSPISLITELSGNELQLLPVSKGDLVYFHENLLEIAGAQDRCRFSYEKADIYNLEVSSSLSRAESEKLVCTEQPPLFTEPVRTPVQKNEVFEQTELVHKHQLSKAQYIGEVFDTYLIV